MKKTMYLKSKQITLLTLGLLMSYWVTAQLPTAPEIANKMTIGWNVGNSLEVPDGETAWGNPMITEELINTVQGSGFNVIRIPCAWNSHADQTTLKINSDWLSRVKEVVDYAYNNGMYVILNSHWDNGWLEENPTYSAQDEVNQKQKTYWTQIANYFISYDEHLLFAGTNEVRFDYGTPTTENIEVQQSYLQTFVDAVRTTGGNNSTRSLIVQTYNTNIWHGLDYFTMPNDVAENRLMVEIHHYDPYQFTITGDCKYWGANFPEQSACTWATEDYITDLFSRVKTEWTDNGIPVIMGEYGALKQVSLNDDDHIASRQYWLEFNTGLAVSSNVIPVYWDNGYYGDGFALFDRNTYETLDQGGVDALMLGAGVTGGPYTITNHVSGSGSISLNPTGGTYERGTEVTLTATADNGYYFAGWSGDMNGTENPYTVTVKRDMNITAVFAIEGTGGTGTILREYWTNISGTAISDLTSHSDYPDHPSGSEQLTLLEGPTNWDDIYATRIRGYIHPITSGEFTFWIAGDDNSELYVSSDSMPSNASLIASVNEYTNSREWDKYNSQKSNAITLTAGEKYYIEVIHKEGYGGDNIAVAWEGPGINKAVIDGAYLSPYITNSTGNTAPKAIISASPKSGIAPLQVNFDASDSSDPNGDELTYNWNFGDSSSGVGETITHTYSTVGTYTATLSVSDGNESDNARVSITVTDDSQTTYCDNPQTITLSFEQNGVGQYCFVTSETISYVNSNSLEKLTINGQDYTNIWSNSMPEAINGSWYIYYEGVYSWSHVEVVGANLKGASMDNQKLDRHEIKVYPIPFKQSVTVEMENTDEVKSIIIIDQSGHQLEVIEKSFIQQKMELGQKLKPGMYFIQIQINNKLQTFNVIKH